MSASRDARYRRKLLILLSSATFFEGYDTFALPFVLSLVLVDLGASERDAGIVRAVTSIGTVIAFVLAARADRIGRKRLLLFTILGYTIATAATALAPGLIWLTGRPVLRPGVPGGRVGGRDHDRGRGVPA